MLGRVVGNYRIVEKIGEGGMGAVFRAVDEMLDREVAIKAIRPELAREPQIVERFRAEAKILARVSHPAIATIYSFFYDGGELFLAMEFVSGRTLAEVIADQGALPWRRAVSLLSTALEGIEQAHRVGIIHRDLKPDNLMLTEAGTLKVMDFGIARMAGSSHMTQTGLLVGTLRYVAPEQIRGEEVDQRTDIYSLGAVLYQMLTARVPFDGPTDFAILKAQLDDPPVPPASRVPGLPGWVDRAVLMALEKQPAARFQTVEELRLYLQRQSETPIGTRTEAGELPTLVLPPRPERTGSTVASAASAATVETDRTRPPSLPTSAAPPPISSTSYRPVEGAGWKRGALAAVLAVVVLAAGIVLWTRRGPEEPVSAAAPLVTSPAGAASTAAPSSLTPAEPEPASNATVEAASSTAAAQPPAPAPAPRTREMPKPASPSPSTPTVPSLPPATAEPEPPPARTEPVPAEPSPEPPAAEPQTPTSADELPLEELRRLGSELVTASEKLGESYTAFLEHKEDGGADITDSDEKLQEELELLTDAANRFHNRFKEGIFLRTRDRVRKTDQRADTLRRFRDVATVAGRVEALIAQAQPSPEVRQDWLEVRRRWTRAAEILRAR